MNDLVQAPFTKPAFYGWKNAWVLFFVYMATTGLVFYAFAVIFPVMIQTTGWNRGDASIAISVGMLAGGFLVPIAVAILNRIGSRKAIIIGLTILIIGLLLLATTVTQLWHWIVIWGVLIPMGRVLCGLLPIQVNIMFWFNRKRATALGLVMTGAPLGGFIAPPVYTWFMTVMKGWRMGWLLSAGMAILGLIISFWVKSKPADLGQFPDGIDSNSGGPNAGRDQTGARTHRTQTTWTVREVFRSPAIWFITVANITQMMTIIQVNNHGVLHLMDLGYTNMQAAFVLSSIILSSGIVRFPMGWIGDRIEPRWIISGALALMLMGFICIWKAPSMRLLMVFGPIYGIAYGTLLVIVPTMIGNYYGADIFASINGFLAPFLTVITAFVPTAAGYAVEKLGSYNEVFLIMTCLLVGGLICSAFLSPPKKIR